MKQYSIFPLFTRRPEPTTAEAIVDSEKSEDAKETEAEGEKKPDQLKKGAKRRGYWKKVRVRPVDTFETAESQHIGKHYLNTLIPSQDTNKFNFDKTTTLKKDSEDNKEEQVVNWTRETTVSPVEEEVKELNKDDAVRNNSEEEVEKVETSTLIPETESDDKETVTTVLPDTAREVVTEDDSNMFDEVRKSLKDLFGMTDEENDDETSNLNVSTTLMPQTEEVESVEEVTTINPEIVSIETTVAPTADSVSVTTGDSNVPSDPMGSLVLATSTSRHISLETEICYRGRCIKTDKKLEKK